MTKFILVRNGVADYSYLNQNNMMFAKKEWAFLSEEGIEQSRLAAITPDIKDADIIISSPYPKALQTASIISEINGIPIEGEIGLHDWVSNKLYVNARSFAKDYRKVMDDFMKNRNTTGENYEALQTVQKRALLTLRNYLIYDKVIAVTHGAVIFALTKEKVSHGGTVEVEYEEDMIKKEKVLLKVNEKI